MFRPSNERQLAHGATSTRYARCHWEILVAKPQVGALGFNNRAVTCSTVVINYPQGAMLWGMKLLCGFLTNKNRQSTVIWLWFNNAFKGGSKWAIKCVTCSLLYDSPDPLSELMPFKHPSSPREGLEGSKPMSMIPSAGEATCQPSQAFPRPFTFLGPLSPFPFLLLFFSELAPFLNYKSWMVMQLSLPLKPLVRKAECHPYLWALNGFYQSEVTLNHTQAVINTNDST